MLKIHFVSYDCEGYENSFQIYKLNQSKKVPHERVIIVLSYVNKETQSKKVSHERVIIGLSYVNKDPYLQKQGTIIAFISNMCPHIERMCKMHC